MNSNVKLWLNRWVPASDGMGRGKAAMSVPAVNEKTIADCVLVVCCEGVGERGGVSEGVGGGRECVLFEMVIAHHETVVTQTRVHDGKRGD